MSEKNKENWGDFTGEYVEPLGLDFESVEKCENPYELSLEYNEAERKRQIDFDNALAEVSHLGTQQLVNRMTCLNKARAHVEVREGRSRGSIYSSMLLGEEKRELRELKEDSKIDPELKKNLLKRATEIKGDINVYVHEVLELAYKNEILVEEEFRRRVHEFLKKTLLSEGRGIVFPPLRTTSEIYVLDKSNVSKDYIDKESDLSRELEMVLKEAPKKAKDMKDEEKEVFAERLHIMAKVKEMFERQYKKVPSYIGLVLNKNGNLEEIYLKGLHFSEQLAKILDQESGSDLVNGSFNPLALKKIDSDLEYYPHDDDSGDFDICIPVEVFDGVLRDVIKVRVNDVVRVVSDNVSEIRPEEGEGAPSDDIFDELERTFGFEPIDDEEKERPHLKVVSGGRKE